MTEHSRPPETKVTIPLEWVDERGFEVPLRPRASVDGASLPTTPMLVRSDTTPPFLPLT